MPLPARGPISKEVFMKRFGFSKSLFLLVSLIALMAMPGFAADKVVTWQVWITPNLTRDFYDGVVKAFEAKNPGIKVSIVEASAATDSQANNFLKLRLASGDVPDVWQNFDLASFAEAGQVWAMPQNDADLKKVNNLMSAEYKGKIYAFFNSVQPQSCMFYNKTMFKTAGITTLPKSWADFEAVCAKLQKAGFTPIITGGEWVPGLQINNWLSADLAKNKPRFWTDYYAGKVKFATTPEITDGIAFLQKLVDKGYFNKGALSIGYADLEGQFLSGKGAMYPMGSWFTAAEAKATDKGFDVGVFTLPTKDGKPSMVATAGYGNSPSVYAKSPVAAEAFKLVKFFVMDPKYGAEFIKVDGLFSNLTPPLTYDMSPLQKELAALTTKGPVVANLQHRLGDPGATGFFDAMTKVGQLILASGSKGGSPAEIAKQFDDYVASLK
jgi:ABC-type glycerol-3-phosphate transport system substrate-binding protein